MLNITASHKKLSSQWGLNANVGREQNYEIVGKYGLGSEMIIKKISSLVHNE